MGSRRPSSRNLKAVGPPPSDTRRRLLDLSDALHPGIGRAKAIDELDRMFVAGSPPDPVPDGFHPGTLLATCTWAPWDGVVARIAHAWMPWQGKSFDAASSTGLNRFTGGAAERRVMRILWPGYRPVSRTADRIEAFQFRNRLEPGALDPGVRVYKIDYDFAANPGFIIRRILDELVQVEDGLYLGKVLMRVGGRYRGIGFFMLERPA